MKVDSYFVLRYGPVAVTAAVSNQQQHNRGSDLIGLLTSSPMQSMIRQTPIDISIIAPQLISNFSKLESPPSK
jgi:hypothetical protein